MQVLISRAHPTAPISLYVRGVGRVARGWWVRCQHAYIQSSLRFSRSPLSRRWSPLSAALSLAAQLPDALLACSWHCGAPSRNPPQELPPPSPRSLCTPRHVAPPSLPPAGQWLLAYAWCTYVSRIFACKPKTAGVRFKVLFCRIR